MRERKIPKMSKLLDIKWIIGPFCFHNQTWFMPYRPLSHTKESPDLRSITNGSIPPPHRRVKYQQWRSISGPAAEPISSPRCHTVKQASVRPLPPSCVRCVGTGVPIMEPVSPATSATTIIGCSQEIRPRRKQEDAACNSRLSPTRPSGLRLADRSHSGSLAVTAAMKKAVNCPFNAQELCLCSITGCPHGRMNKNKLIRQNNSVFQKSGSAV